jgi:hypothetical protein
MNLGSTQPLTEMNTRNFPGGKGRPVHKADNLTAIWEPTVLENVGASTSHNPTALQGLLQGELCLYLTFPLFIWQNRKEYEAKRYLKMCSVIYLNPYWTNLEANGFACTNQVELVLTPYRFSRHVLDPNFDQNNGDSEWRLRQRLQANDSLVP